MNTKVSKVDYIYYGVYIGMEEVIHFTNDRGEALLERVSLEVFKDDNQLCIQTNFLSYKRNSKINPAIKAIKIFQFGEELRYWTTYDYMTNNCEHFANYCATGVKYSRQSNRWKKTIKTS